MKRTIRNGFTLIELLVVITVIGILAAIVSTAVNHALVSAKETTCRTNLRTFGQALEAEFLEDLIIPSDLIITQHEMPPTQIASSARTAGLPMACLPRFSTRPPYTPPGSTTPTAHSSPTMSAPGSGTEMRSSKFLKPYCPLATPNPVFEVDPINEPKSRSFGIRTTMLGASLDQAGWVLAESELRHISGPEDLAARHRGYVHVYNQGGGVTRMLKEQVEF